MDYELNYEGKTKEDALLNEIPQVNFDEVRCRGENKRNRLIKADNLIALKKLLDNGYHGEIMCVYIDPPYSTEREFEGKSIWYQDHMEITGELAYKDNLTESEYIEFIRQRVILLRELLHDKGSIFIHLDQKMMPQVKIIMDEIFGENRFVNLITRRKCSSKNYTKNQFGNITDYLLYYSKTSDRKWNRPYKEWEEEHAKKEYPRVEEETGRRFKQVPIYARGERNGATGEPWRGMNPPEGKHWITSPENLEKMDEEGRIYWSPNDNPRKKIYLDESDGVPYTDLWMDFRDAHNQNVSVTGYPTEKNSEMLEMIIEATTDEGDIVLDCFCGSGTTLAAAEKNERKWIGIDNSEVAIEVCEERLKQIIEPDDQKDLLSNSGFTVEEVKDKQLVT